MRDEIPFHAGQHSVPNQNADRFPTESCPASNGIASRFQWNHWPTSTGIRSGGAKHFFSTLTACCTPVSIFPMRLLALLPNLPRHWLGQAFRSSSRRAGVLTAHFLNFGGCSRKFWPSELLVLPGSRTKENSPVGMKSARLSDTTESLAGEYSMTAKLNFPPPSVLN